MGLVQLHHLEMLNKILYYIIDIVIYYRNFGINFKLPKTGNVVWYRDYSGVGKAIVYESNQYHIAARIKNDNLTSKHIKQKI